MPKIPSLNREQAKILLEAAFKRQSSVVFGGSKIRGDFMIYRQLGFGERVFDKENLYSNSLLS